MRGHRVMRRYLLAAALSLFCAGAHAQGEPPPNTFSNFITNAPVATSPLSPQDAIPVIQNGTTHRIAPGSVITGVLTAANLSALKAITPTAGAFVYREGYSTFGDNGQAFYLFSTSPCSLNAGAGDNGFQVQPAAGTGCWTAFIDGDPNLALWGTLGSADDTPIWRAADAAIGSAAWPSAASKVIFLGKIITYVNNLILANAAGILGNNKYTSVIAQSQAGTPTVNDDVITYEGPGAFFAENIQFSAPLYNPASWGTAPTCHDFLQVVPATSTRAANFTARHLRFLGCTNHLVASQTEYTDIDDLFNDRGYGFGWIVSDQGDTATVRTQHIRIRNTQGRGMGQYCGSLPADAANGVPIQAPRDIEIINARCDASGFIASKQCFDITGTSADQMKIDVWGSNCFNGGLSTKKSDGGVASTDNVPNELRNQRIKVTYYSNIDGGWCFNPNYETNSSIISPDQRRMMYADIYCTYTKAGLYQNSWYYDVGDVVKNAANGNIYLAIAPGVTSASGTGPAGTATAISDGTVTWQYVQAAPSGDLAASLEGVRLAAITDAEIHLHSQGLAAGYEIVPQGSSDNTVRRVNLWMTGTVNRACLYDTVPSEFGLQDAAVTEAYLHFDCKSLGLGGQNGAITIGAVSGGHGVAWDKTEFVGGRIEATAGDAFYTSTGGVNVTFNGTHLTGFAGGVFTQGIDTLRLLNTAIDVTNASATQTPIEASGAGAGGSITSDGLVAVRTAVPVGGGSYPTTSLASSASTVFKIRAIRGYAAVSPVATGCSGGDSFLASAPGVGGQPTNGWGCTGPSSTSGTWTSW